MTSNFVLPFSADRAQPRKDRVVVDLLMPQPTSCALCQDAIEEIDDAAALLAHELAARGTTMQVRVTNRTYPAAQGAHSAWPPLELRVNGVTIEPNGTQDCGDGGATACGAYEWDGATYAAPPAELLTGVIHDYLDRNHRGPGVIGGSVALRRSEVVTGQLRPVSRTLRSLGSARTAAA